MSIQDFDGNRPAFGPLGRLYHQVFSHVQTWVTHDIFALFTRIVIAGVFWRSFILKVETFGVMRYVEVINDFEIERFRFKLPDIPFTLKTTTLNQFAGDFSLPLLSPGVAAWMATLAEFALPILLVLGLLTRLSALALIGMTLVIQIFIFPTWAHFWGTAAMWIIMLAYLAARGGGRISLDYLIGKRFGK
jgi:putative oxidoreductase